MQALSRWASGPSGIRCLASALRGVDASASALPLALPARGVPGALNPADLVRAAAPWAGHYLPRFFSAPVGGAVPYAQLTVGGFWLAGGR